MKLKKLLCTRSPKTERKFNFEANLLDHCKDNNNNKSLWNGNKNIWHRLSDGEKSNNSSVSDSSDMVGFCRSPVERKESPTGSIASTQSHQSQLTPSRQLSDGEKLKKTISELIDTEKTYVKHLNTLLENYLEPLRNAPFLSSAEVTALFGNIREIVSFQRLFLQALNQAVDMEPEFLKFEHPYEFKNVLFSIGSAFLYYATQFKLYSSFCASNSKAQKVLRPSEGNQALQDFLLSRNPRQQHSSTLESYLIKPIQRILKYPLLLQQLKALTQPGSEEHKHLIDALKVMEKVAEHINEMQRIHEEYGAIFDHLFRQHQKSMKQEIDLSPGDLLYYGGVEWLNISDFLGKIKKGLELHAMCFVFKTAVVFLCKERLRQKKKLMGGSGKNSSAEVEIIRYQVLIPVTEVQVRASSMKDMDNHYLWELIHLKSQSQRRSEKVYHLSNSTSEFRNSFLKTIRQIIRQSVRNMSIPGLNKPGGPSGSSDRDSSMGGGYGGTIRSSNNTLQPRSGGGRKRHPSSQTGSLQRHGGSKYDYDTVESYDNVPESALTSQNSIKREPPQVPKRSTKSSYSPANTEKLAVTKQQMISELQLQQKKCSSQYANCQQPDNFVRQNGQRPPMIQEPSESFDSDVQQNSLRKDELSDSTTKSDARDDFMTRSEADDIDVLDKHKKSLGRTPKQLSLSTTSTLSTGSTSSQARLIQASNQPSNYQPAKGTGSPIWKPRENFGSTHSVKSAIGSSSTFNSGGNKLRQNGNVYGTDNANHASRDEPFESKSKRENEFNDWCTDPHNLNAKLHKSFSTVNIHNCHSKNTFDNINVNNMELFNISKAKPKISDITKSYSSLIEELSVYTGVGTFLPRMRTVKARRNLSIQTINEPNNLFLKSHSAESYKSNPTCLDCTLNQQFNSCKCHNFQHNSCSKVASIKYDIYPFDHVQGKRFVKEGSTFKLMDCFEFNGINVTSDSQISLNLPDCNKYKRKISCGSDYTTNFNNCKCDKYINSINSNDNNISNNESNDRKNGINTDDKDLKHKNDHIIKSSCIKNSNSCENICGEKNINNTYNTIKSSISQNNDKSGKWNSVSFNHININSKYNNNYKNNVVSNELEDYAKTFRKNEFNLSKKTSGNKNKPKITRTSSDIFDRHILNVKNNAINRNLCGNNDVVDRDSNRKSAYLHFPKNEEYKSMNSSKGNSINNSKLNLFCIDCNNNKSSTKCRASLIDEHLLNYSKYDFTRRQQSKLEESFDRLSACLIDCDPWFKPNDNIYDSYPTNIGKNFRNNSRISDKGRKFSSNINLSKLNKEEDKMKFSLSGENYFSAEKNVQENCMSNFGNSRFSDSVLKNNNDSIKQTATKRKYDRSFKNGMSNLDKFSEILDNNNEKATIPKTINKNNSFPLFSINGNNAASSEQLNSKKPTIHKIRIYSDLEGTAKSIKPSSKSNKTSNCIDSNNKSEFIPVFIYETCLEREKKSKKDAENNKKTIDLISSSIFSDIFNPILMQDNISESSKCGKNKFFDNMRQLYDKVNTDNKPVISSINSNKEAVLNQNNLAKSLENNSISENIFNSYKIDSEPISSCENKISRINTGSDSDSKNSNSIINENSNNERNTGNSYNEIVTNNRNTDDYANLILNKKDEKQRYSDSINVLNSTALNIDSLINQLKMI